MQITEKITLKMNEWKKFYICISEIFTNIIFTMQLKSFYQNRIVTSETTDFFEKNKTDIN